MKYYKDKKTGKKILAEINVKTRTKDRISLLDPKRGTIFYGVSIDMVNDNWEEINEDEF